MWAQGTPHVPSHSTDMQEFIKGGLGGRRALLSHHLSKGQIKKYSRGPRSRKTVVIVLCHLLGKLQVLLLTLPALLESKGGGWWQVGTGVTSFPWPQWLQRSHLCRFQVLVVRFGWEPHGLEKKKRRRRSSELSQP